MIRLEIVRKTQGLTQTELARRILYSKATISRLEKREPEPSQVHPRLRAALEAYFKVSIAKLLEPIDPEAF